MVHIRIKKGLDIPLKGKPKGEVVPLVLSGEAGPRKPSRLSLNLSEFQDYHFRLLVKVDDAIELGQPLVEVKELPGVVFVAPGAGKIQEIRRGLKRAITDIVITLTQEEKKVRHSPFNPQEASKEAIIERFKVGGGFAHIRKRPFDFLANPSENPRAIFVKAIESLPLIPPAHLQVQGHEALFQVGLDALLKIAPVHLISRPGQFSNFKGVTHHTAEGPHPIGNLSVHIEQVSPLKGPHDSLWTLNVFDVLVLGSLLYHGEYFVEKVIGIGGPACVSDRTGFFKVRSGYPIDGLISGRVPHKEKVRLISGDPLIGHQVSIDDFLHFNDFAVTLLEEVTDREFLHFFRLGTHKYSFSKAYASGHLDPSKNSFDFTTSQHGEERPFIDASLYNKVQPLSISTMPLVKAVMAEDYELAENLGLAEVVPEDFALTTFVCPSKIEMTEIIRRGQKAYAKDVLQ